MAIFGLLANILKYRIKGILVSSQYIAVRKEAAMANHREASKVGN